MIKQELSELGLGGDVSLIGVVGLQDPLGTEPNILDLFRLKHPESNDTKVVVEIGDKNFMAKRLGIATRHIVYADLPETVKAVLKRRRQFQQHTEEARELCTTKSDQQEAVEANVDAFEDALQTVLRNLGGDDAMELKSDVTLQLDINTTDHFHVSDGTQFYGTIITPDQAKDVAAIETQIKATQDQATLLEWAVDIAQKKALKNHEATAKMYELAASLANAASRRARTCSAVDTGGNEHRQHRRYLPSYLRH